MRIKTIESQHRRDFTATYICEHCGAEERKSGYDDSYFHQNVIPQMVCETCGRTAPAEYQPQATRYHDSQEV